MTTFKQSATDILKKNFKKEEFQKTAEAAGDLIDDKIANKIRNKSPKNNSETDSQIDEKAISPEERQKIIDDLRLI